LAYSVEHCTRAGVLRAFVDSLQASKVLERIDQAGCFDWRDRKATSEGEVFEGACDRSDRRVLFEPISTDYRSGVVAANIIVEGADAGRGWPMLGGRTH
jgi:hypothetical protein